MAQSDEKVEKATTSPPTNTEDATGAHRADGTVAPDGNVGEPPEVEGKDNTKGRKASSKAESLRDRFLELSGYEDSDIIGANAERRTFVTSNGGKYEVSPKGKKLRRLAGPPTPVELEPEEEEEE